MSNPMTDAERADMYRRQLGGTNAALRRARQEIKELRGDCDALSELARDMFESMCTVSETWAFDEYAVRCARLGVL